MSRSLRSYPALPKSEPVASSHEVVEDESAAPVVESNQILLNQTPDYQQVQQSDSESAVSSNSSSDTHGHGQTHPETDTPPAAAVYEGPNTQKESWREPTGSTVIIQQHRTDEM